MTIKIISAIHFEAFILWKKGAIYRKKRKKLKIIQVMKINNEFI